ncbi:MAG: peptidylprolyl isomerase [Deltaproteobacteria bacterium]|nr:peptidylprolyl isomerase [Deltaproteobacteria bacterium]
MTKLLVLIFPVFFSFSTGAATPPVLFNKLEAAVNKTAILYSDVLLFKKTLPLRTQLDPLFNGTPLAAKGAQAGNEEIIDFLINEKIILQQFLVADQETEQAITAIQTENKIDRVKLKKALTDQGFSFDDYFELIRISVSKRNLIDRDIRTKVNISDEDVKNYYYNYYAKGTNIPFVYNVKIITATKENYKTLLATKDVIYRAKKKISDGEAFEEVSKQLSDHPTASTGGDLGELTEDQMSPQIREHLKKMKLGEVSDVLGNYQSGFFMLKLSAVKTSDQEKFLKIQEEIRNHLLTIEFQRQIMLWQDRERQKAFIYKAKQK